MILRHRGFTLIEHCVTLAIVAILAANAAPSFSSLIERQRLRAAVQEMTLALARARAEALTGGRRVAIAARGTDWRSGWQVFRDDNDNGRLDGGEPVMAEAVPPHPAVTIVASFGSSGSTPVLSYDANGFARRPGGHGLLMGRMVFTAGTVSQTLCFGATRVRLADGAGC